MEREANVSPASLVKHLNVPLGAGGAGENNMNKSMLHFWQKILNIMRNPVELPNPENLSTLSVVRSSDKGELLNKEDGTYWIKDKKSGRGIGPFLTIEHALEEWKVFISESDE